MEAGIGMSEQKIVIQEVRGALVRYRCDCGAVKVVSGFPGLRALLDTLVALAPNILSLE